MKVIVVQKGAREHFLAARALHQHRCLSGLVVDWHAPHSHIMRKLLQRMGSLGASALAARAEGIPDSMIKTLPLYSLWAKWQERRAAAQNRLYACYPRTDAAFARRVARLRLGEHDVIFGYSYSSLEAIDTAKKNKRFTVVCQIDPGPFEYRLVAEEMSRFPQLAGLAEPFPQTHFNRAIREWSIADIVLVNSEWSRQALISEGANPDKIEILPLAYDPVPFQRTPSPAKFDAARPLRALWLGQVNVRKGIHYLIDAARKLEHQPIEITVAGPLQIQNSAVISAPRNIRWIGPIPRSHVKDVYGSHDIFLLPTLSDGFAITQIEAMAHGLPVIATPNCGKVVENCASGFIVPPRDAEALANAVSIFLNNPSLLPKMSVQCFERAKEFSIDSYGRNLVSIIHRRLDAAKN